MDEFLKMDIFFFVATLGVVLISVLFGIVLWRVARVLKNVEHVSKQVSLESDIVREDLATMRSDIQKGKNRFLALLGFVERQADKKRAKNS